MVVKLDKLDIMMQAVAENDAEIYNLLCDERQRQERHIELIASENYTSLAVMAAQGSLLTNKYAEGYPGHRYYGGCEYIDKIESLAIERAKKLFSVDYANVQPHSGAQANMAVFMALMKPGDTYLGMDLNQGGHLSHGSKVNFSGKHYNAISYGVSDDTGDIDYQQLEDLAIKHSPKLIIAGFSAYSGLIDWARFRKIADMVGAYLMADIAHVAGMVAVGLYASPFEHAHVVTTTTHKSLRGPRGGLILSKGHPELHRKLNSGVFPGVQGGPLQHVIAAKAICFSEALGSNFHIYQAQVMKNARVMAERFIQHGLPVIGGGTKNHMFLLNLEGYGVTGHDFEHWLEMAGIAVNKNCIPNDKLPPMQASGIRIGTPCVTTRGFAGEEVIMVADWVNELLNNMHNNTVLHDVQQKVLDLCGRFPVYSL